MRSRYGHSGKILQVLLLALAGWGVLSAQEQQGQPFVWLPPLPAGPYALGHNPENGNTAPDEPIPGFVGPAGDGVSPYAGQNPAQQINPVFVEWASSVFNYSPAKPTVIDPTFLNPGVALGSVTGDVFDVVSLGDLSTTDIAAGVSPGSLTLGFASPIADGPGADFVVFGNAFNLRANGKEMVFSKLAFVEVSSDGVNFARFPSVDANPKPKQSNWSYMVADPTLIYNLFGKALNGYGVSWGVPFDLAQLSQHPLVRAGLLDLQNVRYVRFVAVVGNGAYSHDFLGNPIYDPWPTFGSPGPEVQAVGVLNSASNTNSNRGTLGASENTALAAQATPSLSRGNAKSNPTKQSANSSTPNALSTSYYSTLGNLDLNLATADLSPLVVAAALASDAAADDGADSTDSPGPYAASPSDDIPTPADQPLSADVATADRSDNNGMPTLVREGINPLVPQFISNNSVTTLPTAGSPPGSGSVGVAERKSSVTASVGLFGGGRGKFIALALGGLLAGWILSIRTRTANVRRKSER